MGDILTEDNYNGHQIYVKAVKKDETGKDVLVLDTNSTHPSIKKPLMIILPGLHLFKAKSNINYRGLADAYANTRYKMEVGDAVSKFEKHEEIKDSFEAGFLQAVELFKIDKKGMCETFEIVNIEN